MDAPMRQFLQWVEARPRTYSETMDAWRTSCPRLALWEDAQDAGFLTLAGGPDETLVALTDAGRRALAR